MKKKSNEITTLNSNKEEDYELLNIYKSKIQEIKVYLKSNNRTGKNGVIVKELMKELPEYFQLATNLEKVIIEKYGSSEMNNEASLLDSGILENINGK